MSALALGSSEAVVDVATSNLQMYLGKDSSRNGAEAKGGPRAVNTDNGPKDCAHHSSHPVTR